MKRAMVVLFTVAILPGVARAEVVGEGELTLEEALRVTRANHPQIQAAQAQLEVSAARVQEARASLLPQVSGTASYQRSTRNASATTLLPGSTTPVTVTGLSSSNAYNLGLSASQLIYDFGQTTGRWDAAKATWQSQAQAQRATAAQIFFGLRAAYYAAAATRAQVKVMAENLANQEAHLRQIQGFVEAGTRPEIDLAQARTDRANARVQLINAQVAYDTSKALLNQAMGVERATDYDVAEPQFAAVDGEDGGTDGLLSAALAARPDLLVLARQIDAQESTTKSIKGGYAPTLNASTGLTESGAAIDSLQWGWYGKLSLNWQIFGGGITDQQLREARAGAAVLRAQYELQRQQVRADVEQARLTLAEGRYQAGVGNVIELGDSQLAHTTAAGQEVVATYNLATARAKLLLALGRL
jgi:outer membrane protein